MENHVALTVVSIATLATASLADIVFEENFRNYKDHAPGIVTAEGIEVGNDPIHARAAELNVNAKASVQLYTNGIALPAGNKFDLLVKIRFLNSKMPKAADEKSGTPAEPGAPAYFDIVFANKSGKKQSIRVASDKIAGAPIEMLGNGQWEELVVKTDGANADFYLTKFHVFNKVASVQLTNTFDTLNFAADAEKGFSLRDIVVRTPDAMPNYAAEKHFASFKSLTQPLANAKTASSNETVSLPNTERSGIRFILGSTNASATVNFAWSNGSVTKLRFHAGVFKDKPRASLLGKPGNTEYFFSDAVIDCSNWTLRQFVRPCLWSYGSRFGADTKAHDIVRDWDLLPPASEHTADFEFVRRGDGRLSFYIDGSFRGTIDPPKAPANADGTPQPVPAATNITFNFSAGVQYAVKADKLAAADTGRFEVLDLAANPRAKAFADASFAPGVKTGLNTIDGVPLDIVKPLDSADVAICETSVGSGLELWEYLGRTPEHGYPSAIHYRLPAATYTKAHVVFALDPDKQKDAIFNLRLSHYINYGIGDNMIAITKIDFSDGNIPDNVKKIGEVVKDGKKVPLYLASFDLDIGKIIDHTTRYDYMDFELVGKCIGNMEQKSFENYPDPDSKSAFNAFAVTLEKFPVLVDFKQYEPGNVFTIDEKARNRKTAVTVTAVRDNVKGKVAWTARDTDGKEVFKGEKHFSLATAGTSNIFDVALGKVGTGFYELDYVISCETPIDPNAAATAPAGFNGGDAYRVGNTDHGSRTTGHASQKTGHLPLTTSFTHNARFAILPPAGRKVNKHECPYATWRYAFPAADEFEADGPFLHKAGIKRATFKKFTPETSEKYDVTSCGNVIALHEGNFDSSTGKFKPCTIKVPDPADPTGKNMITKEIDGEESFVRDIKEQMAKSFDIDHILLWHESAPWGDIPEEILGRPLTQESKDRIEGDKIHAAYIKEVARIVRKHFPNLRIEIGNSNGSFGAVARPLRADKSITNCYDAIGIECGGQLIVPERLFDFGIEAAVIARDTFTAIAGYEPRMNGCYEFSYRCERDMGERLQAEWYMRDILVSLSHGYTLISPGVLFDVTGGYYNTGWGASGILSRRPYGYPKRAYAAYAALTYALDGVKLVRKMETGSSSVYALEFKRCDGKYAYALWAARGEVKFGIDAPSSCKLVGFFGAESKIRSGKRTVDGGSAPVYLVTDKPLKSVTIEGRSFADDYAVAKDTKVASALDKSEELFLEPDPLVESTHAKFLPIMEKGNFTLAQVKDDEKGDCVEITLCTNDGRRVSNFITEYTTLRLKEPKLIEGRPEVVGVWVKGNSSWGQIRFEIEDAKGEIFKNISTGKSWGCDIYDWSCFAGVNFDGWSYVYVPVQQTDLIPSHGPGPWMEQWVSCGGDKKIDFPVKVRAITVGMNRHKLNLNRFENTAPSIRLRDVGGR